MFVEEISDSDGGTTVNDCPAARCAHPLMQVIIYQVGLVQKTRQANF